jgi:virulence-associated protein VagC
MIVNPTNLRKNIYQILADVMENGKTIEIQRKGKKAFITPAQKTSRLKNLKKQKALIGNPEDIVHIEWSEYWEKGI